jgi:SAM-dependent methyltransferase
LLDADSAQWTEPLVRQIVTAILRLPAVAEAYKSGGGVPWESFGPDMSIAQGDVNRPALRHSLPKDWVPQIPDLRDRLAGRVRVADVGCGHGWSAVGLASAFPGIEVDGFDVDAAALQAAKRRRSPTPWSSSSTKRPTRCSRPRPTRSSGCCTASVC